MLELPDHPDNPNGVHIFSQDMLKHGKPENLYSAVGFESTIVDEYLKNGDGMLAGINLDRKYAAVRGHARFFKLQIIQAVVSKAQSKALMDAVMAIDPKAEAIAYGNVDITKNILGYAEEPHKNGHENDYPYIETRAEAEDIYKATNPTDMPNYKGHQIPHLKW